MLPQALTDAIAALGHLPGVGPRTAERYAYYLFNSSPRITENIISALENLHQKIKTCPITFAIMDATDTISPLYTDPTRDKTTILVVEAPLDIYAIERTRAYRGVYHVLGGALSPIDGITPEQLHIPELLTRIKSDKVTEIIIATNPSVEGESTAILLQSTLQKSHPKLHITRLARGLPLGISLEYADLITLTSALDNRTQI